MIRMTPKAGRPVRVVAALAAAMLLLAACNGEDDTDVGVDDADGETEIDDDAGDQEAAADGDRPDFLTLATGSTGGTYFPLGGAIAGVWNDNIEDLRVSTQSSGASVDNLQLLDAGEVELIMAVNGVAADAIEGASDDFPEPMDDFAFLGNIYGEVMQVVAHGDSGIESIADMEGATVAIGPPGSGTEVVARQMLEAQGLDPDNDIDARQESFGDAADGLRDGQIDAVFAILALPAGAIEDVATGTDLNYVSIDDDLVQTLLDDETLSELEVDPDTYPGQDESVTWVTNWATLYAPVDLHEDVAYDIVRVLYDQNESIAEAHAVGGQIQIDTALDGRAGIPIHPGAQRYYDEVGAEENGAADDMDDDGDEDA